MEYSYSGKNDGGRHQGVHFRWRNGIDHTFMGYINWLFDLEDQQRISNCP
jgi:hypothetical protein